MAIPEVDAVVRGAMEEMLKSLKMKWEIPHSFLQWYADKEMTRFRCKLLFDPVSRVAREPLRKLDIHGRLIGAAQICLALGIVPTNVLTGITGALLFENKTDPDHHLAFLRRSMPRDLFNTYILGLRAGEPLDLLLRERIDDVIAQLEALAKLSRP
jgi:mannitol-1-phosphate/altronate dehydrogenase